MPGQVEKDYIYLPIDSKFPLADYYRLEDAYGGDKEEIDFCRKSLLTSVKRFAKDTEKYPAPPATTGFWSDVFANGRAIQGVRNQGVTICARDEQIVVAGPSTLSALLNSLSVGLKRSIFKSADDISKVLRKCQIRV